MLLPSLFIITLNNEAEQSPALKSLLKHHPSYSSPYTFYEKVLPFIKWVRGEAGTFKHFKSWGYFENFPKTTTAAMSGNHRPLMSQRVQFSCTIVWLWCSCRLSWGIYILIFLPSLISLHYFLKVCCEHFPTVLKKWVLKLSFTYSRKIIITGEV
jgi:hypothetical protein